MGVNLLLDDIPVPGNITIRTDGGGNDVVAVAIDPGASIGGNLSIDTGIGADSVSITSPGGGVIGGERFPHQCQLRWWDPQPTLGRGVCWRQRRD